MGLAAVSLGLWNCIPQLISELERRSLQFCARHLCHSLRHRTGLSRFGIFAQPINTDLSCSSHDNCRLSDAENDYVDLSNLSVPGTVLMIVCVTVVMVLLNLVVAHMSASHEKINQHCKSGQLHAMNVSQVKNKRNSPQFS